MTSAKNVSHKQRGYDAEQYVSQQLTDKGFSVVVQNYQKQFGEIDIIAQKKDLTIFVEVKYRKNPLFDMSAIITPTKKKKIIAVAKQYIAENNLDTHTFRFDVAFVKNDKALNNPMSLMYLENAFQSDE